MVGKNAQLKTKINEGEAGCYWECLSYIFGGGRLTLLLNAVGFGAVSFPATVAGALANRSLPALRCGLVERAR